MENQRTVTVSANLQPPFDRRLHMKHGDFKEVIQRHGQMASQQWPSEQAFNPPSNEGSAWSMVSSEKLFKGVDRLQTDG